MSDINKILIGDSPVKDVFLGTVPIKGIMLGESYKYAITHSAFITVYPGVAQISYSIVVAGTEVIKQTQDVSSFFIYDKKQIKIPDIPHGARLTATVSCSPGYTILNSPIYPINSVITAMANFVIEPVPVTNPRNYFRIYTILDQQLCSACSFDLAVSNDFGYIRPSNIVSGEQRVEIDGGSSDKLCVDIRPLDDYIGFTQLESIIYNNEEQAMTESGTYPVYLTCNDKYAGDIYISLKHTPDSAENVDLAYNFGTILSTDLHPTLQHSSSVSSLINCIPKQGGITLKYGQGSLRISGFIPSNFTSNAPGLIGTLPIGYRPSAPTSFTVVCTSFWECSTGIWKPWNTPTSSTKPAEIIIDGLGHIYAACSCECQPLDLLDRYYSISSVDFEVLFDKDGTVRAVHDNL